MSNEMAGGETWSMTPVPVPSSDRVYLAGHALAALIRNGSCSAHNADAWADEYMVKMGRACVRMADAVLAGLKESDSANET
jgi:hypothetical protein